MCGSYLVRADSLCCDVDRLSPEDSAVGASRQSILLILQITVKVTTENLLEGYDLMFDLKPLAIVGGKLDGFFPVALYSLVNRNRSDFRSRKSKGQLLQDHQEAQAVLASGHRDGHMVVG